GRWFASQRLSLSRPGFTNRETRLAPQHGRISNCAHRKKRISAWISQAQRGFEKGDHRLAILGGKFQAERKSFQPLSSHCKACSRSAYSHRANGLDVVFVAVLLRRFEAIRRRRFVVGIQRRPVASGAARARTPLPAAD